MKNKNSNNPLFGLHWNGKQLAYEQAFTNPKYRLTASKPIPEEGGQNLFVEGDNLEVLKLLLPDFESKVKLIYIDPPYNTGQDFVYSDKFASKKQKEATDSAYRHENWLSMIYPRLILATKMLKKDGLIMISIDESAQAYLQLLCHEVFGEDNFIGNFIWANRTTPNDAKLNFATDHEYILVYAKDSSTINFKGVKKDLSNYKNKDKDPKGDWIADNPSAASGTESYRYPIINPYTKEKYFPPKGRYWAFAERRVAEWTKSKKMIFPKQKGKRFLLKKYKKDLKSNLKPMSSIIKDILTAQGTRELKAIYEEGSPFKYPKPTALLIKLFEQITSGDDIILDFFAGSGSTAHAVLQLNAKDKGDRQFICVQKAEKTQRNTDAYRQYGFDTISDLSLDRINRVLKLYKKELSNTGLRVLRLRK